MHNFVWMLDNHWMGGVFESPLEQYSLGFHRRFLWQHLQTFPLYTCRNQPVYNDHPYPAEHYPTSDPWNNTYTHIIICPDSVHCGHYSREREREREREIYVNIFFYLHGKTLLHENLHYNLSKEKLQMALHVKIIAFLWYTHTFKIMFILCHTFIFCPR